MNDLDKIKDYFSHDLFATETSGIVIEDARPNYAKCSLKVERRHLNANNTVMGGALFTLADFTFAIASNTGDYSTVSLSSSITYFSPAGEGTTLYAESECIKSGRSTCTFVIHITDDKGKKIAMVTCNGFHTN